MLLHRGVSLKDAWILKRVVQAILEFSLDRNACVSIAYGILNCLPFRLKAMREAASAEEKQAVPDTAQAETPILKFRNYNVRDQKIEHTVLEPAKPPEFEPPKPQASEGRPVEVTAIECHWSTFLSTLWHDTRATHLSVYT